jgi:hypothetical protein
MIAFLILWLPIVAAVWLLAGPLVAFPLVTLTLLMVLPYYSH